MKSRSLSSPNTVPTSLRPPPRSRHCAVEPVSSLSAGRSHHTPTVTCGDEARARDGSTVELYARLGCGAGRITHTLRDLGHRVVAVDQCPAMAAWVRGAETVVASSDAALSAAGLRRHAWLDGRRSWLLA